jgi:membrane associated rhomboid family serine protease
MLTIPKWTEFPKYPVVAGTAVLAAILTAAWWTKTDVSALLPSAEIRRGEVWRLFTGVFLHVDILHLVFNLYWLWLFGTPVEQVFGHSKTVLLFAFFALGSSAFEFALDQGGIGLSGIGYGLFGMLWVLSHRDDRFRGIVGSRTAVLFIGWFFFCIATTVTHAYPVGNVAHGAGAILGILAGYSASTPGRRSLANAGITLLIIFGVWGATLGRPFVNMSGKAGYDEAKWGYDALNQKQDQQALGWLKDASRLQPRSAVIWYDLGLAYSRTGNPKEAKNAYARAHELEPANREYSDVLNGSE